MKKVSLDKVLTALRDEVTDVAMDGTLIKDALAPMQRMLELSR